MISGGYLQVGVRSLELVDGRADVPRNRVGSLVVRVLGRLDCWGRNAKGIALAEMCVEWYLWASLGELKVDLRNEGQGDLDRVEGNGRYPCLCQFQLSGTIHITHLTAC
jgi:hypothetical protein